MPYQELPWADRGRLWLRLLVRLAIGTVALLIIFKIGLPVLSYCMPFVLAFFLVWLLEPVVRKLEKKTFFSRGAISILVVLLICSLLFGLLSWIIYRIFLEISSLANNWSVLLATLNGTMAQLDSSLNDLLNFLPAAAQDVLGDLTQQLVDWVTNLSVSSLIPKTTSFASQIPSVVVAAIFFLMACYFIMADYPKVSHSFTHWMPENMRAFFRFVGRTFQAAFGGYIRAQLLLSLVVFFILVVGFTLMGIPYGFLLALLLAVIDFIPIIGAGTVMVPWAVVDMVLGDWSQAVALLIVWGIIAVFRRVAEPRFLGSQTGLNPILSLLSIFVGMKSFGILGMVLAPTLLLVLINVAKSGVFEGLVCDISMAFEDISAFLQSWRRDKAHYRASSADSPGSEETVSVTTGADSPETNEKETS